MNKQLKYIELKSDYDNDGPAWIGMVAFSKSGRTLYFDGKAFRRAEPAGGIGNYYDIETSDEYWISGVKKNGTDRLSGNAIINVEGRVLDQYLRIIGRKDLDASRYRICSVIEEIPVEKFRLLENEISKSPEINDSGRFKNPNEMSDMELDYFIKLYREESAYGPYLKSRKYARNKHEELMNEKQKREIKRRQSNQI